MKAKYILYYLAIFAITLFSGGCEMEEDPAFPSGKNLYSNVEGANNVLNSCYATLAGFNYYGADFIHLTYMSSGLFTTGKDANLTDIVALQTPPSLKYVENVWQSGYQAIGRTNDVIDNLTKVTLNNEEEQNNILGQAYFIRGLTYFNLVRIYGGVPLIESTVTTETLNQPRAPVEDVYDLIISDLNNAASLLKEPGAQTPGRPAKYAANMLLAKVYMTLAGDQTASETEYWQKAYDEAIKVYGKYSLVPDYRSLWFAETGNNTVESVFEIQGNVENTLRLHQLFTPSKGNIGESVWGRIVPHCECWDLHAARYPNDPRLESTFLTEYPMYKNGEFFKTMETYPYFTRRRGSKRKSYPFLFKYYIKDPLKLNYNTNMNFVLLRYADLLLMLAEIENELNGPGNAYQYVNEVLARARQSAEEPTNDPADWSGMTQEQFRDSIMYEYRYELLGEGHDWFNNRRRGYAHFKENVIDVHNNTEIYDFSIKRDVYLPDNPRNMLMPVPLSEITANPNINGGDQNPGY